nr:retrovirus-related Pol polyprotein from transposon TNT 1-94 [Tanacetum cinerariifolium]
NELPFEPNIPALEDVSTFNISSNDEDDGAMANMNNLDTTIQVSPILTTRIHKDHPLDQVIRDLHSATQTRQMLNNLEEHGFVSTIQQRINHKDLQNCLFACFLSHEEHKKTLVDLPNRKRAIGTKWVFNNKKDERGIVIRNKAKLVAQGHTQEERIDYDKVFALVARTEAIRLFLAYVCFNDFVVYQMNVKSAFLYEKIEEEVYVCQPPGFEDPDFSDKMSSMREYTFFLGLKVKQKKEGIFISQDKYVVENLKKFGFTKVKNASTPMETQKPLLKDKDGEEVDVHMYRSMIGSLMYLTSSRPDIMFALCACARYQVNPKVLHLYAVKRIFRTVLVYCCGQTINGVAQLHVRVDGKKVIISEASIRRDLQFADEEGIDCLPNSTIFEQLASMGKPIRKVSEVPQPSDPIEHVADEAVHKELEDSLVRAATTASSLEAKQDSNTLKSDEDRLKLNELIEVFTNLQTRVLDLKKTKTTQANVIDSLKRRVKKLEKRNMSRTYKLKRLYKVSLTARVESLDNEESLVDVEMFDADKDLGGEEVFVEQEVVADKEKIDEVTLTQALAELKTSKPKAKWDDVQAKIDADHQLAERLQAEEQHELIDEEKATLFMQFLEKRRKLFAATRAKEKRNKPPTQTQKRKNVYYLKNMEGYTLKQLKEFEFDKVQKMFDKGIVDWKIYKEGKKSYYQIIRADGKSQMYMFFSQMLTSFDREDLEDLYKKDISLYTTYTYNDVRKKFQVDYQSEMAYHLVKLIMRHHKK